MAKSKVYRHSFEIEIKSNEANEKSIKFELSEALNYYFSIKNYLTNSRTNLNKIKLIVNGKQATRSKTT